MRTRKKVDRRGKKATPRLSKKRTAKIRPAYERDDGPLTAKQIRAIKKLVPQGRGMVVTSYLFPDELTKPSPKRRVSRGAKAENKKWDAFQPMPDWRRRDLHETAEKRYARIAKTGETIPWPEMRSYLRSRIAGKNPRRPRARKLGR